MIAGRRKRLVVMPVDFPGFASRLLLGGVYEQQAIHRRIQNRTSKTGDGARLFCWRRDISMVARTYTIIGTTLEPVQKVGSGIG